jgi:hypothetical protein
VEAEPREWNTREYNTKYENEEASHLLVGDSHGKFVVGDESEVGL